MLSGSILRLFVTPRPAAHQTLLSTGFSKQGYWSGLPFPPPGYLPDLWIFSCIGRQILYKTEPPGKPQKWAHIYDTAIPLLGIHTEETRSERDTCTPMFIAALFIIARTWKQPRCPSVDEWIRKLWYIYTMEYYSALKKNSFESVLMRWMKLEPIIQSEVSQKDKDLYSILTHIYGI